MAILHLISLIVSIAAGQKDYLVKSADGPVYLMQKDTIHGSTVSCPLIYIVHIYIHAAISQTVNRRENVTI